MLLALAGVVGGLALLTYAADQFVVGAARVAISMRISKIVVGAVVIGFGTSAPELLVSGLAGLQGALDLAIGNIVGSNVANLTLVLGAAALVTPIEVRVGVLKREALLSLGLVALFGWLLQGGVSVAEAIVLSAAFLAALAFIVIDSRRSDDLLAAEVEEFLDGHEVSIRKEWTRTVLGLIGTLAAAQILVVSATAIAELLGLAQGFVGLTVVAVGTSLPELAAALQAARKDETDLIVGNLLGSNMFNAGAVGATAAFAGVGQIASQTILSTGVVLMVAVAVVATGFMVTGRRVVRWEGALLVAGYLAVLPLLAA